jgi:hypothetical protein
MFLYLFFTCLCSRLQVRLTTVFFERTWNSEMYDCVVLMGGMYIDEPGINDKVKLNDGNKI